MNYVESFDLLGVAARQKPCLTGIGAPAVPAVSGELYLDTASGDLYKCVNGLWQRDKSSGDIPFFDLEALGFRGDMEAKPVVQEISVAPALMAQMTAAMDAGPISVKIGFYDVDREYGTAVIPGYAWHVNESGDYGLPIQLGYYGSRPVTVIIVFHPDRNTVSGDAWLLTDDGRLEEALAACQPLIPTLDLISLGVPTVAVGAGQTVSKTVTSSQLTDIVSALNASGLVKLRTRANMSGAIMESTTTFCVMKYLGAAGMDVYQMCCLVGGVGSFMCEVHTDARRIDMVSYLLA